MGDWLDRISLAVGKPLPPVVGVALWIVQAAGLVLVFADYSPEFHQMIEARTGLSLPRVAGITSLYFVFVAALVGHDHAVRRRKQLLGEAPIPPESTPEILKRSRLLLLITFLIGAALMIWVIIDIERPEARCEAYVSARRTYPNEVVPCPPEVSDPR